MQNDVYVEEDTSIWEYLHNKRVHIFVTRFHRCSMFIKTFIFGGFALRLIVFVYKLIIYEIIFITWLCNKNYFEVNC